jgi:hypothetical protein
MSGASSSKHIHIGHWKRPYGRSLFNLLGTEYKRNIKSTSDTGLNRMQPEARFLDGSSSINGRLCIQGGKMGYNS